MDAKTEAAQIHKTASGPERDCAQDQLSNAGLDPDVMEATVRYTLEQATTEQRMILALDPGVGIMLGMTLAATYISKQKAANAMQGSCS